MESQVRVVKKDNIPRIQSVDQGGDVHVVGELRDFRWSDELREFLREASSFSASWVRLDRGEVLQTHTHPVQSMMVVYSGSGEMRGDLCRSVAEGDVIVVPAGQRHGFAGGEGGLNALSIQFGGGLYSAPEKARVIFGDSEKSFDGLLASNDRRMARFAGHELFGLMEDGTLRDPAKRVAFRDALRTLLDGGRRLRVSCAAGCSDPRYRAWFLDCLPMEGPEHFGTPSGALDRAPDAILESISDWFVHQMYVLDEVEKAAIVCLVFGNAESMLRHLAMRGLGRFGESGFEKEAGDAELLTAGADLLRNETPETYARVKEIIGEAWDMMEAAGTRLLELTSLPS